MNTRENISVNYLYFRSPIEYILVLLPPLVGLWINIITDYNSVIESATNGLILSQVYDDIDNYLIAVKLSSILLIAFLVSYKWVSMTSDGSYAFWITLGIKKYKFFLLTIFKFIFLLLLGQIIGLGTLMYMNEYYLATDTLIFLVIGIISHLFFIMAVAIFLSTIITSPEISSLMYITIMGFIFLMITEPSSIFHQIFHSDLHYFRSSAIIAILLSFLLSIILLAVSLKIHLSKDLES